MQCGAENVECCLNISAFNLQFAADHTGHLILVPEEHLCYSENVFDVFNFGFFKRISGFLDDLVSKYSSGVPCFVP